MATDVLENHEARARREQWKLEQLPWQEPLTFCGDTRREQTICKLDSVTVTEALFLFELGIRHQISENLRQMTCLPGSLLACTRWHDTDTLRHLWALRMLRQLIRTTGSRVRERKREVSSPIPPFHLPSQLLGQFSIDAYALDLLIRASVAHYLYEFVGKRGRVPHVRAVFSACAPDALRHQDYLRAWLKPRLSTRDAAFNKSLQLAAIKQTAKVTGAIRPSLRALAGAGQTSKTDVASGLFSAVSAALLKLGPSWKQYPAQLVHTAARSPWLIWMLR